MKKERVKMTLLLDSETIQLLKDYSYETTGSTNVSKAVMSIAKDIEETKKTQQQANNGWQNIGIMKQYARENIDFKYRNMFMEIVQESFGYGLSKTLHKTQKYWSDLFGISERTFRTHINKLALDGHIKINHQKGYMSGGGSKAYSYSPAYPSNANIWMKDIKKDKDNHSGSMSEFEKQKNKLFKDGF